MIVEERLEKMGMTSAAKTLADMRAAHRKMAVAYEHYRFVRPEKISAFQEKVRKDSKYLRFTALKDYPNIPPEPVLKEIEAAIEKGCFDSFEIADIAMIPDPIVFGRIEKCDDRFFIAQWDDDVKIEDILGPNEG